MGKLKNLKDENMDLEDPAALQRLKEAAGVAKS